MYTQLHTHNLYYGYGDKHQVRLNTHHSAFQFKVQHDKQSLAHPVALQADETTTFLY